MKLSVSGKIIKEISEKIPSTTYAIVELIKNAYEAMASFIEINIYDNKIEIIDDGSGMNLIDIKDLLIVSHSNKEYGVIKNGRIISGEKGLGFFSVFKFGGHISVETSNQGSDYKFILDMNEIEKLKDIQDSDIDIIHSKSIDLNKHGTKIVIDNLDIETIKIFKKMLDNPSNFLKLKYAIRDDTFEIRINKHYKNSSKISLDINNSEVSDKIIAKSYFDSNSNKTNTGFFYRIAINDEWYDLDIDKKYNDLLLDDNFEIKFDIDYYKFNSGGIKKVSCYYKDQNLKKISPLIYFNNVYFPNEMYDVEINASRNNKNVIRQQTGIININLFKKGILDFNSDRTIIIESKNEILLKEFLDFISSSSQIKIKEIEDLKKHKKPNIKKINMMKEESLADKGVDDTNIKEIYFEDSLVKLFDSKKLGSWKIYHKNGDITNIDVVDYPDAKMRFLVNTIEVGKEYNINDIIEVFDCKGTKKIKTYSISINPTKKVSYNKSNESFIVMSPTNVEFDIKFSDKISNKEFNFKQTLICIDNKKVDIKTIKTGFIYSLISIKDTSILDEDLSNFIYEFNKSYNDNSYKLLRLASLRTLLEVITCDILDKLEKHKSEYLKENIKKIFSDSIIKQNLFSKINDSRDKKSLKSIYDLYKQSLISGSWVDKYNLSTHGLTRIVHEEFYINDQPIFNLLYSYLLFVSSI
ncbi:ATP-binding protein [Lactobacillus iners]|uniref:ATP-binding protein n=1 Tax=Lactobacillus iners TaxID=147802 RepID=UPI0039A47721